MAFSPIQRLDSSIRIRRLSSRERAGRYSRELAWKQIKPFLRDKQGPFLFLGFFPLGIGLLLLPFVHGRIVWVLIGALGISGPWAIFATSVVMSGIAKDFMAIDGETSTADVFRRYRRRGWVVINGLNISDQSTNWDVDHVAVGPAGFIVVESKWSRDAWPMAELYIKGMSERVNGAIRQVLRNQRDVEEEFKDVLKGVKVRAICVLWSGNYLPDGKPSFEQDGVTVISGPHLAGWLKSLDEKEPTKGEIETIWRAIDRHVLLRDLADNPDGKIFRPTLGTFFFDAILTPIYISFLGAVIALFGLVALNHFRPNWGLGTAATFLAVGLIAKRLKFNRWFTVGWIGTSLAILVISAIVALVNRFH